MADQPRFSVEFSTVKPEGDPEQVIQQVTARASGSSMTFHSSRDWRDFVEAVRAFDNSLDRWRWDMPD